MRTSTSHIAVAAVALSIGVAGSAGAAKLITGSQIKDGSIGLKDLSKSARKSLQGKTGRTGASGPQGPQGTAGPQGLPGPQGAQGQQGASGTAGINGSDGQPGQSGSAAPALLFTNAGLDTTQDRWMAPGIGGASGTENTVPLPSGVGLTARDLTVSLQNAPGVGKSFVFTFRKNQTNTGLACTVSGTSKTCSAPSEVTVPLVAGDLLSINAHPVGSPTTGVANLSMRLVF